MNPIVLADVTDTLNAEEIIKKLIPNWTSFVVQLLAFLVLVAVVIYFAYKPAKKMIQKRQDYIEDNIKQSEIAKSRANDNIIKSEETLTNSQKQANEIIEQAKLDAENEKSRILLETDKMVTKMKADAEADIKQSKEDAKEEIRKEMVNLALDASSEILSRNVNTKDNEKLADDFIRSIDR
ncbi:MAG: F0F1 ATP synthase subunit B [Bacilli bacterium]|nr:F0F1 ATP synthase subunit B [Bacilli bacterium]